ncbi:beta-glucosidase [Robertkochia solimangrovi]|uniref:beta-glucosidase n=1 Tax=Robertkochia solimangrovi TaxID=2213046 RepID=UPI0018EF81A6|nr:glycoside hydrolase family 3 protein [Robertkochia solimangrovi]
MKYLFSLFLFAGIVHLHAQTKNDQIDDLLSKLTLEEKVYLVIGSGMDIPGMDMDNTPVQATVGSTKNKVPGAAGTSFTVDRLNIPAIVFADGPAGIRIDPTRTDTPGSTYYATAFPTASSLSSSWNRPLIQQVGAAFGREGKAYGVDFLLAPALNIHRNPLGGRNFEYYSEDPVLSGNTAAAFVNGVQSEGVGATIKHFVANNSETNRTALNTIVSERALREIYLKGFKIAIEKSNPWAVMSSYNKINGTYSSENKELLTDILRDEWNYTGFVMTDWFGGRDAVAQMKAGNDLLMPGTKDQATTLIDAVKNGELDEKILDRNIRHIFNQYLKTSSYNRLPVTNQPDLEGNKSIVRSAAAEGMVLLKNDDDALPLKTNSKIALYGVTSFETIAGGTGSGDVNKAYMVSIYEGLKNKGYIIDQNLATAYQNYIEAEKAKMPPKKFFFEKDILVAEKTFDKVSLSNTAKNNDIAILTLGRTSGEFEDRKKDGDFYLTETEKTLISQVADAFQRENKKLIVILNIGGVIETNSWKSLPDGILVIWQPGQEGGNATADILSGSVVPSGKLPVTFPITLEDLPSTRNFPGHIIDPNAPKPSNPLIGQDSEEIYEEDIYIGYRYFESFEVATSYSFGYGLSYTQFDYADFNIEKEDNMIKVKLRVTNTGKLSGKEVVQLYVSPPQNGIHKAKRELKAYTKTSSLEPGSSEIIELLVPTEDLGYYDSDVNAWLLQGGSYTFEIGKNAHEILDSTKVDLSATTLQKTNDLLAPQIMINTLKPE